MRRRLPLSDSEIEARFEDLGFSVTAEELAYTDETLEDFLASRQEWLEPGVIEQQEPDVLVVTDVRVRPGTSRRDLVVIDFGELRAAYVG